jgi:predicted PurR-regulated permease PerM
MREPTVIERSGVPGNGDVAPIINSLAEAPPPGPRAGAGLRPDTAVPGDPQTPIPSGPIPLRPAPMPHAITLAAAVVVVAGIYFGRDLFIPVALAFLLSFLLAPLVTRLRRWGVSRVIAVILSVTLASGILAAIAGFVAMQVVDLAGNLPTYQSNIEQKVESLRATPNGTVDRVLKMFKRLDSKLKGNDPAPGPAAGDAPPAEMPLEGPVPRPAAEAEAPDLNPIDILSTLLNTTLGPITTGGIVIVLVIFILLEREDIRNRVLRLLGSRPGQLMTSTQALDDAASRVSRYLLMQLVVNLTYGIPIGIGLYFIGVPNPVLWGLLAVVLRFIPYVGPIVAAACPLALAFAVDPGWGMLAWTALLYTVIEVISNNFIETLLYGTSTGISSFGILLSAVFWAWTWGPIGLLMSTPLTVCFVVLGRHIPAFGFFTVLLSDQPVLPLHGVIYQRLLAMDPDEPDELAQTYLAEHSVEEFYENIMLPLLGLLEEEAAHSEIDAARHAFILEHVRELIEDAADHPDPDATRKLAAQTTATDQGDNRTQRESPGAKTPTAGPTSPIVLCVPAHDETDQLAGLMLAILLKRNGTAAATLSAGMLSSERLDRIESMNPRVVCVSVLPPYAMFHARHTIKRIRGRFPEIEIVAGFWPAKEAATDIERRLKASGASDIVWSLKQATETLARRDPRLLGPTG